MYKTYNRMQNDCILLIQNKEISNLLQQQVNTIVQIQPMYNQEEWEDDFELEDEPTNNKKSPPVDQFEQFQADRKILKKNNSQVSDSMNFANSMSKSKSKKDKVKQEEQYADEDEDEYGDDFQKDQGDKKNTLKNSFQKNNKSGSFEHKSSKNKTDNKLKRSPTEKKKISKSSLSLNKKQETKGRYSQEVQKKFYQHNNHSNLNNDAIQRVNTQIRETIKKYNDILSELITKNLNSYMQAKNKKTHTVDDQIKLLQEEIKNNEKMSERLENQLKILHINVQKIQQKEQYADKGIQQEIAEARMEVKERKKLLHQKKIQVQHQGKKLTGGKTIYNESPLDKNSEVTVVKEKLLNMKKQYDKNEQKIEYLQKRSADLGKKLDLIEGKQKQADEIIKASKKTQQKSKKYQEIRKKLQNARNHCNKTTSLWKTKQGVIQHQNQSIRLKIKNIQLEVKNLQQSISSVYEKTQKVLANPKTKKTEQGSQQRILLDKLMDDMKVYDQNIMKKQQSTTQMKLIPNKKSSTANLADYRNEQDLRKSQEEQANRIWKEENQKQKFKNKIEVELKDNDKDKEEEVNQKVKLKEKEKQKQKEGVKKTTDVHGSQKKQVQPKKNQIQQKKIPQSGRYEKPAQKVQKYEERQSLHQQNEVEGDQKENKPKRFNFKKNRKSSEVKLTQVQEQVDPSKQESRKHENQFMPPEGNKNLPAKPEQQKNNQNSENKAFVPKRFNLRAKKSTEQGYMPTDGNKQQQSQPVTQEKGQIQQEAGQKKQETPNQNLSSNRPMFKLKKKNRQSAQNQFIS